MARIEDVAKKLSLWHSKTFRPILTHDDLEPIMAALSFDPVPDDGAQWREYAFHASTPSRRPPPGRGDALAAAREAHEGRQRQPPRPRLPCQRLDGLHLLAYKAFLDAVAFHLGRSRVAELFHIRAMPLTRARDRMLDKTYRPMRDCRMDDDNIFVYREGTLDQITKMTYNSNKDNCGKTNNGSNFRNNCNNNRNATDSLYVSLEDLLPKQDVS